jgi:uncharacterized protein
MQQIPREQVLKRLARENPWWQEPFEIQALYAGWRPRPYLDLFLPLVQSRTVRRAVVLMGPRRVGKTVLLHHAIQRLIRDGIEPRRICYVSIDHPLYNGLSLEQLIEHHTEATGTSAEGAVFVFDEIQYLRDWEIHLKRLVDDYPGTKLVASGSAAAALRLKSHESGAGRFTEFLLPPLTFHEYLVLLGEEGLVEVGGGMDQAPATSDIAALNERFLHYINFGGYPEVVLSPEIQADPGRFVKNDIIDKVLLRDLPSLYGIQDIQELNSLFTTLAFNTAQELSFEPLTVSSGVAKGTLRRYIEYLEAAFLIRVVHRVDDNARRFQRANLFKVYLTNPSLRSALFAPIGEDDEAIGSMVETAVFAQWFHWDEPLHYARWRDGEIDIIYLDPRRQSVLWAAEVKWSDRYLSRPQELRKAIDFCRRNGAESLTVTTRTQTATIEEAGVRLDFIPAALYCFKTGYSLLQLRSFTAPSGT